MFPLQNNSMNVLVKAVAINPHQNEVDTANILVLCYMRARFLFTLRKKEWVKSELMDILFSAGFYCRNSRLSRHKWRNEHNESIFDKVCTVLKGENYEKDISGNRSVIGSI